MQIAYTIAMYAFYGLMVIAGWFNRKAKLWVDGRKNWRAALV